MLLFSIATYYVFSLFWCIALGHDYETEESSGFSSRRLRWPVSYGVNITRINMLDNLVEELSLWKTDTSSRLDYNHGAVKVITKLNSRIKTRGRNYEIRPETTEERWNKIVCHVNPKKTNLKLDNMLPYVSSSYEEVGNETIDGIETIKFESDVDVYPTRYLRYNIPKKEMRRSIWAYYINTIGWIPVKYEVQIFNMEVGALIEHTILMFMDFTRNVDDKVFDQWELGCKRKQMEHHTPDSEVITKELLFIDPDNEEHVDHIFTHFKNKFDRKYAHEQEHALRLAIFNDNVRLISSVNRGNFGYKLAVNQFSDWTAEEFDRSLGAIPRPKSLKATIAFPYNESTVGDMVSQLPKQYDLRLLELISPVKYQSTCGCCWTFAATAATESGLANINGGRVMALSNQALVDCAYDRLAIVGSGGCKGGFDYAAYEFIMEYGLPTEEEYGSYTAKENFCKIGNMTKTYRISGYTEVTHNNFNSMKVAMVKHGPLYVSVHVSKAFKLYHSGIFYESNQKCDPDRPTHAVALVGYGERDSELFWILKNSWGIHWGMNGYMLIAAKDNVCGVASRPSYPVFH